MNVRKCLIIVGTIAAALMFASSASAAGSNGVWGKGSLSETLLFDQVSSDVTEGYLYWNSDLSQFVYDFHGYYLETGVVYSLVCFEGTGDEEPSDFTELGSASVCEYLGVHIRGAIDWSLLEDAPMICLVPDTWTGLGGSDAWTPDEYLMAEGPIDL